VDVIVYVQIKPRWKWELLKQIARMISSKKRNPYLKLGNGERVSVMIDRILLKFFGGIDTFTEWLFAWQKPRCKCKNKTRKHG
jgi:hypothetical protein